MIIGSVENADKLVGRYFIGRDNNNIYELVKRNNIFQRKIITQGFAGLFLPLDIFTEWHVKPLDEVEEKKFKKTFADKNKLQFDLIPNRIFL